MRLCILALAALCCAVISSAAHIDSSKQDVKEATNVLEDKMETIAETEKKLKKIVNSGFKMALPYLITGATEVRLKTRCMQGLFMTVKGVMDLKDWAIKMVDAMGRPSAGILEGTAIAMGDYDECLDVVAPRRLRPTPIPPYTLKQTAFRGQYCVVQIHLPSSIKQAAMDYQLGNRSTSELANSKTFLRNLVKLAPRADVAEFRLGVCTPSVCDKADVQAIIDQVVELVQIKATAMRCEVKEDRKMTTEQTAVLCCIAFVFLLSLVGTSVDVFFRFTREETIDDKSLENESFLVQSILSFSISRNVQKLLSLQPNDHPQISCLRGMKFISICLYIVVWTYATPQDFHFLKFQSAFSFLKFMEEWWFTIFANASAGVDSLFLIAGLQVSYRLWWKSKSGKVSISIPKFILKWYSRFTLSQVIAIGLFVCLPLMGNGPIWDDVVTPAVENCKERWWLNVLALNNFWSSDKTCLPNSWLLCSMLHLMFLAPIVLYILSKSTTVGIFVNLILILGSSTAIAIVTLMNDLPPAPAFYFLSFINVKTIWEKLFIQAYDHLAPFCIGMLLGFFFNQHDKIKLNKTAVTLGWCIAVTVDLAVMCGLYGYRHGEGMEMTLAAVYAAVHRVAWALGIAWMIFACAYGYGGVANSILSWNIFIIFDRLTNLTYLLHPLVLLLHEGQLRDKMYMGHFDQAMYAIASIVCSVGIAAVCYVTCVAPFLFFERMLWYHEPVRVEANEEIAQVQQAPVVKEDISSSHHFSNRRLQFFQQPMYIIPSNEKTLNT